MNEWQSRHAVVQVPKKGRRCKTIADLQRLIWDYQPSLEIHYVDL